MKKIKYYFWGIILVLPQILFSQKNQQVQLKLISDIDSTINLSDILKHGKILVFEIKNYSKAEIEILNVPIKLFHFSVLKKIDNEYISIDSSCSFSPQSIFPAEGIKKIKLKKYQEKEIRFDFPPGCMMEVGNYEIKFKFGYYIQKRQFWAETRWYKLAVIK